MNKKLISGVLVAGLVASSLGITSNVANAAAPAPVVLWGNMELVQGQIGKVTILHDTPLYKLGSNKKMTVVRTLKKGSSYRVYSISKWGGVTYYAVGAGSYVKASSLVKYETPSKALLDEVNGTAPAPVVMWGNMQLVKGQMGKVSILHDTPLYKHGSNRHMTIVRTLKKGSSYRVYSVSKFGGVTYYGVGAGSYVKASSLVKYETVPKEKLQALGISVSSQTLQPGIVYPKISLLTSKTIEANINHVFYQYALNVKKTDAKFKQYEQQDKANGMWNGASYDDTLDFTVAYNQNNILSITTDEYGYSGGAHGFDYALGYNFDLLTGKELKLADVIKTNTQLQKVNKWIKAEMIHENNLNIRGFDVSSFKSIDLQNDQFYFTSDGIVIVFQEYEYGPYANGINSFKVPYSVFK